MYDQMELRIACKNMLRKGWYYNIFLPPPPLIFFYVSPLFFDAKKYGLDSIVVDGRLL